jgi:hypothetical protein
MHIVVKFISSINCESKGFYILKKSNGVICLEKLLIIVTRKAF